MFRTATYLHQTGILNHRLVIPAQFVRKLKPKRVLSTLECSCDTTQPSTRQIVPPGPCLMDTVPLPEISWQQKYDEDNKKNTRHLIIGGGFFFLTLLIFRRMPAVKGYEIYIF
ncbi:uncharacterized protein LOC105696051 [Orussus abietinus]|uniref:uncharacterized protein LOC105696051 n=1 Tax=Orussus abietinus TaxID=222816 RepID=UPI000626253C|nr:uncharacterized protein LOC105696051 [Orussus abietinus]